MQIYTKKLPSKFYQEKKVKFNPQLPKEVEKAKKNGAFLKVSGRLQGYPESISPKCQSETERPHSSTITNTNEEFEKFIKVDRPIRNPDKIYKCTKAFIWGTTAANNYYKLLSCGKEWCSDCGEMHSFCHDKRIGKLLPKFKGLFYNGFSIGYLVVTVPAQLWPRFNSQQVLNDFRSYWREKIKRWCKANDLPDVGLIRYHWAGEDGYNFKPHLNILFPTISKGYLSKEQLSEWAAENARWLKSYFELKKTPAPGVHYGYEMHDFTKVSFWLSYVTRSTQRIYRKETAELIFKYKNSVTFGKPENWPPDPNPDEVKSEAVEVHPDGTKEKIIWQMKWDDFKKRNVPDTVPLHFIDLENMELISRGFWKQAKIPPQPPPEILIKTENLLLLNFAEDETCPF